MEKNQSKLKVAIIGAGIIGLYLGWKLSEKGHQVTIFEKRGKIGKEACSGLFSERLLQFIPESQKLVQIRLHTLSGPPTLAETARPPTLSTGISQMG